MLRLLIDESVDGDITRGLLRRQPDLDSLGAQDCGLRTAADQVILEQAARDGRVVVTQDLDTMIGYAYTRVRLGQVMPGLFVVSQNVPIGDAIEAILLVAIGSDEGEWEAQVVHLPL